MLSCDGQVPGGGLDSPDSHNLVIHRIRSRPRLPPLRPPHTHGAAKTRRPRRLQSSPGLHAPLRVGHSVHVLCCPGTRLSRVSAQGSQHPSRSLGENTAQRPNQRRRVAGARVRQTPAVCISPHQGLSSLRLDNPFPFALYTVTCCFSIVPLDPLPNLLPLHSLLTTRHSLPSLPICFSRRSLSCSRLRLP